MDHQKNFNKANLYNVYPIKKSLDVCAVGNNLLTSAILNELVREKLVQYVLGGEKAWSNICLEFYPSPTQHLND